MAKKDEKRQQSAKAKAPAQEQARPSKMSFDAWWAVTAKKIAEHHRKEIVFADFKARGLSANETMAAYNNALQRYGVKLS